jgi:flagellar assembly protein FliH
MDKKFSKLDQTTGREVRAFEMTNLNPSAAGSFRTPTLDTKRANHPSIPISELARKDRRFQVDPVLRDLIAVDEKTNQEVEVRVREKIDALRDAAESAGRDAGYEEGYARGKAEAKTSFEAATAETLARLDALVAGFEGVKTEVFHANERFLVELVYRVAGTILQREILVDPEYVARVVRSVVEKVGVKEQLKLITSPAQIEGLYALLPELEKKYADLKNVTIETSSQLGDSDVVVETDWNRIDATLETQLGSLHEVVLAALDESRLAADSEGDPSESEPESA